MDQRSVLYSNLRMIDFEVGQPSQSYLHTEPCMLLGSAFIFPQPYAPSVLPPLGSIPSFDFPHFPEHHDATAFFRTPQYANRMHPSTNLEFAIPAPAAFYNPFLNHGSIMFSDPISHGSLDQQPSSSNFQGSLAYANNGYGRNNGFRVLGKRNNSEGTFRSFCYGFNPSSAPGASMPAVNGFQFDDGVLVMDASFPGPDYRGSYMGPSFGPAAPAWSDHQSNSVSRDTGALPFNQPSTIPYFEASNISGGSSDIANVGGQRFHEGASTSHVPSSFLHSAPMIQHRHDFHTSLIIHEASRYNVNYHPPIATTSSIIPVNNALQYGTNFVSPPPTGVRIYRSHRRGSFAESVQRHRDLPHFRIIPEEGTAMLEFPGYYEISNMIDHHRDLRLDVDYMSYEELLALGERIGNVKTGLSEETIKAHLKTRVYRSTSNINLEELPSNDESNDYCVICQDEYQEGDTVGTLDCGHKYHLDCILKWLPVKNACPVCKSIALDVERKDA